MASTGIRCAALAAALLILPTCASQQQQAVRIPLVTASVSNAGPISIPPPGNPVVLPPLSSGNIVNLNLVLLDRTIEIAPDTRYKAWTFNGTIPGPVVHVRVGQTINVALTNRSALGHSIDFHAALAPPNIAYQTIAPGQTLRFSWVATSPGAFLYHCGTPPVLMHISNGMYGAVIVDPQNGWPDGDMQSYVFVQSEFYTQSVPGQSGVYQGDLQKMRHNSPDFVVFNGYGMQYSEKPLPVTVDKPVRVFVVDAGPSHFSAFHVIGTIFEKAYVGGNPANALIGLQTLPIAPGDGAMLEFTVHQAGRYTFVTHQFGDADLGAMGAFQAQ